MRLPVPFALLTLTLALAACRAEDHSTRTSRLEATPENAAMQPSPQDFYSLHSDALDGWPVDFATYRGKVALVVNVASQCGFTPQYAGLQKLHSEWKARGFTVLGFPSTDFGGQEPGTAQEIRDFCTTNYRVDFPMFAKVHTKAGDGQSPIYALLGEAAGQLPNWNFCKYLVGKNGEVIAFYPSKVAPEDPQLRAAIEAALK
jgi:glutathione peroxidase